MRIIREHVSPEMAERLLTMNVKNRRINTNLVASYVKEMKDGRWKEDTGEMIIVSKKGRLLDGQHRLLAIVQSGMSFHFHVGYDVDDSVFDVLDSGKPRGAADIFSIKDVKNPTQMGATIRKVLAFRSNIFYHTGNDLKISNSIIYDEYKDRPDFYDNLISNSGNLRNKFSRVLDATTIGALICTLNEISVSDSEDFISQLCTGANITNNTILLLRNVLIKDKIATRKLPAKQKIALIIKTWNCYRLKKEVKVLSIPDAGDFPKLV